MRIVIKVGTSTLAYPTGHVNLRRISRLCRVISDFKNAGHEMILVSSGAIGMGVGKLSLGARPDSIQGKQAAAAIGQCELMYTYDKEFSEYHHTVAQLLLTGSEVEQPEHYRNFMNTMEQLLAWQVLPVINENDTVVTKEIAIGDNDTLAAIVAASVHADVLVLLSDIDGLFTANPRLDPTATLIPEVPELTPEIMALAGDAGSKLGTGGMVTKLSAAKLCTEAGCDMIIANGANPDILYSLLDGVSFGTRFRAKKEVKA